MRGILYCLLLFTSIRIYSQNTASGGKLRPEQAIMDIRHYTIALNIDIAQKSIDGYTIIDLILSQPSAVLVFNLMNELTVKEIAVNGKKSDFKQADNLITISPTATLTAGKVSVKIAYAGKPHIATRPPWEDGFTWTTDSTGHPWVAITAAGTGGKLYFPCKDHPSDEPNEGVDLNITVPKDLVVAGPGLLQKITRQKNTATYYWKTNYTINNYSILFNVGDYEVVTKTYTTINGNKVPMQFYVLKEHASKAAHHLDVLETMVRVKEKYFGEYPWAKEKIGIAETPHLGMEHQSMNAYGNHFKYTKVGGQDFDWLMNHEFGHEWWANKVTAKDWADYWIHEGIGSYGDVLYTREVEGEEAYIKHFKQSIFGIANQKPVVMGSDLDEETAYHGDIYGKGAFFMHTLRYVIGDTIFFPTLKQLSTDPQYTYNNLVNTNDVEALFSKNSHLNLKPLFDLYLRTIQKLEIHVTAMKGNAYKIQLNNIDMDLPLDITTDKGVQHIIAGKKEVIINSTILPQVDPDTYYIKKIIIE